MKITQIFASLLAALMLAAGIAACSQDEGPAEKAGKKIDDAAEQAGDAAQKAADSTGEAIENAGDAAEEQTDQ